MPKHARLIGWGSYVPDNLVSNEKLKGMITNFDAERAGMPFEQWSEQVSGIKQRYYIGEHDTTEIMASEASKKAMATAGIRIEEIDFIIDKLPPIIDRLRTMSPFWDVDKACARQ